MKKSTLSLIIASVVFSSNTMAVQDPNKYTQDQHHIMLDIMEVEAHQNATDQKVNNINVNVEQANQNSSEALNKVNNLEGRVTTNESNIEVLQDTKADKSDLTDLENKGKDFVADVNTRIENTAQYLIDNKDEINGKLNAAVDNSVTNYINSEGSSVNVMVNGAKETANDFDRRIADNQKNIQSNKAKNEAVWELTFGGQPHFNDKGEFDGFLRAESDKLVVGPNGEFYGYKENAGLYGKFALKNQEQDNRLNNHTARIDGNDKRIEGLQETKADKTDLADLESKGQDAYTELNGKVNSITNASTTVLTSAIKLGNYVKDNTDSIKGNISGVVNNVIDNSVTNLVNNEGSKVNLVVNGAKETANDFEQRITKNTSDIAAQDKIISKQGERLTNVEYTADNNKLAITKLNTETQRLEDVKADRVELEALEQKGNDAYNNVNAKVDSVTNDVEIINNKITKVEGVAGSIVANKDVIVNKAGDVYEGVRTDITNEINTSVNAAVSGIKGDINNSWVNNKDGIKANVNGKYEGAKTEITNNVLNEIGDIAIGDSETIVNIKNDISKDVTNQLKLDAKDLAINIKKDIVEGNNEYVNQIKGEVSNQVNIAKDAAETVVKDFQDQIDATNANVDGQVKRGEIAYANLKQQGDDNSQAIINVSGKVDGAIEDGTYWITNLQNQIDMNVEAGKTELTNISGKVDNAIQIGGDKITNLEQQIVEGNTTIIADVDAKLEDNSKKLIAMGQNESNRLEQELRNDGQDAYDDLLVRIDNATSKEDVDAILNEYKKQALANIRATVTKNGHAVVDGLQQAKDDAKQKAEDYVKNEIDQAIADNTQAGKDYVKGEIDNAIAGMVPGANDLDGRIEKLENTVNKGQVIVNNVKDAGKTAGGALINKAPVVKGEVIAKANTAINAGRTINDKANEALAIGANNTVAINQERTDRIQGQRETLKTSMAYTDSRFNSMQNQVDANRKRAAGGISGVSAMTNIPQLSGSATYSFGVGIGGFDGEQSIAAGGSARIKDNVVIRSSVSTSTEGEMVWGAGVGFEW
ncbi:YadA-like family protein [Proteus cibi]|uniref:YadA-like family protein n=1 Tax=Proteus cibi TaxID=2050966 RepID=UPI0013A59F8C|nr:YadA-like family protein [Proteus cibi]